jgi:hypothetical protein
MAKYDYEQTVKLPHNKRLVSVDVETGDMQDIPKRMNNILKGKRLVKQTNFSKVNINAISLLKDKLSNIELGIVFQMIGIAEYNTNSLKPLNNDTTVRELSERFGVGVNQVKKNFKNLFDLGVYAQLSIARDDGNEFWILNPYISFKGKTAEDSLFDNFQNTQITKYLVTNK